MTLPLHAGFEQTGDIRGITNRFVDVFVKRFCDSCRERGGCAAERQTRLLVRVSMGAASGS